MARILVVGKYYHPFFGGIEKNTKSVCDSAIRKNRVLVIVNGHQESQYEIRRVGRVPVLRRRAVLVWKGQPISPVLLGGIRVEDFDVIHLHSPNPYASFVLWYRMLLSRRVPAIVVTHHMDVTGRPFLRRLVLPFIHHTLRHARCVIVTSEKNRRNSRDLPRDCRTEVVPLGVSVRDFELDDAFRAKARAWRTALCGEAPVVGFCGRLVPYKGVDVLLQALKRLPDVHALIAGDGPSRRQAERLAENLGLAKRVTFLGRVDHETKCKLLSAIDCFAFPSVDETEAFGIGLLEAMLCGAPVVASDLPTGVSDVAMRDKTALVVKPKDPERLAAAISRILQDPELARSLAHASREHVRQNMDADICAQRTVDILEQAARSTQLRREPGRDRRTRRPFRFRELRPFGLPLLTGWRSAARLQSVQPK